jgi:omega-hydroxy-beta-dihydromenaquinone-9 sulfotransferase
MPRSGTSLIYASFASHPDLAWFSQYQDRFPWFPGVAVLGRLPGLGSGLRKGVPRRGERKGLMERLRVAPAEAYAVWERCCGERFIYDYLLGEVPDAGERACMLATVRRTARLQGKPRFTAKVTGPARIQYLTTAFEGARFIHVIRDPRGVVDSLLRVPFWRDTHRLTRPAWSGGLSAAEVQAWSDSQSSPVALAAVQWGAVLRHAREEAAQFAADRYLEIRYEDFVAEPHAALTRMFEFSHLTDAPEAHGFIEDRVAVRDLGAGWRKRLTSDDVASIQHLLAEPMTELGYSP